MKKLILFLSLVLSVGFASAQSEVPSDSIRRTPSSNMKEFGGFLLDMGLMNVALSDDACRLKNGFIEPINRYLKSEQNKMQALRALNNTLDTKQARRLNSDDKTFLWAGL